MARTQKARAKTEEARAIRRAAKKVLRPSRERALDVGSQWLDDSGVGQLLDPRDGDAVLASLVDTLLGFAAAPSGGPAR